MSSVERESLSSVQRPGEDWRAAYPTRGRSRDYGGPPWRLLMTGLIVVGLGVMAWSYLGPDLRRYLKISNM
jgi:hypothetical protein